MKSIRFRIILVFCSFQYLYSNGQSSPFAYQATSVKTDSVKKIYFSKQWKELAIYNGRLFRGYEYGIEGHGFYFSSDWQIGNIQYDGIWYNDLPLRYDIYKDEVMVNHPNNIPIILFGERVQQFHFAGLHFFRLKTNIKNEHSVGIYQLLSDGKIKLLSRRSKIIEENLENKKVEKKFIDQHKYYLVKDGEYHLVRNQKSVLNVLSDRRQEIIKDLKKNNIRFKTDPEKAIIHIADFYNQSH